MPRFAYQALTPEGTVESGVREARSEAELEAYLRETGQYLVSADSPAEESEAPPPPRAARKLTDGGISRLDLLAFTEYLWGAVEAGIPILTILSDVETQLTSKRMRKIVAEIREAMFQEGKTLSEAMAEHPKAFPPLFVRTIEAGEATGHLDFVLEQLAKHLEWQQEISLQLRQVSLYPLMVLAAAVTLVVVLVAFVYPKLLPVFTSFDIEMPLPTRIVLAGGGFLREQWLPLLGSLAAAAVGVSLALRTERGRWISDSLQLRLPILGTLRHQLEMARVVTYLALFYRTGIDLLRGLEMLEQIMTNRRIASAIRRAREEIGRGASISQAFGETGLFPTVVVRSIALGESTGKLDETLERARLYYAREGPAAVRRMLSILQPTMVVVLGAFITLVALSIFLPIVNIYESIGP